MIRKRNEKWLRMLLCRFEEARDSFIAGFAEQHLRTKSILEVGCGGGDRTRLFYAGSCQVVGIDISRVEKAPERFQFLLADATRLPFKEESFEAIVSFDVIEHVLDDKRFVSESFRVCKTGGLLILGTPNRERLSNRLRSMLGKRISYPYLIGPSTIHVREYTMDECVVLIQECGWIFSYGWRSWVGLVGRLDKGLAKIPTFLQPLSQYLLVIGFKPLNKQKH